MRKDTFSPGQLNHKKYHYLSPAVVYYLLSWLLEKYGGVEDGKTKACLQSCQFQLSRIWWLHRQIWCFFRQIWCFSRWIWWFGPAWRPGRNTYFSGRQDVRSTWLFLAFCRCIQATLRSSATRLASGWRKGTANGRTTKRAARWGCCCRLPWSSACSCTRRPCDSRWMRYWLKNTSTLAYTLSPSSAYCQQSSFSSPTSKSLGGGLK